MFDRISHRLYRLATSLRHRATRRFTRSGLFVFLGLALTGAMAADPDQSLAYQTFALLLCLLVVSLMGTLVFRGRFEARRELPRFGTVGEPMPYRIVLRNLTGKSQRHLELLEDLADPRPSFEDFVDSLHATGARRSFRLAAAPTFRAALTSGIPVPFLAPNERAEVRATLTPLRRGVLRFAGLTVTRPDPLGLCRAFRRLPLPESVLVLPRRFMLPPFALPGTMKYQQGGVALAASVGESEECISLREYRRGDPLRRVHWRSWARLGRPIVKEYQDEFFVRHALILDTFADAGRRAVFEDAVSLAASLACTIQTQESLLDLMFVGPQAFRFTAGRGLAHTEQMLEILASVRTCREKPFQTLTRLVLEHAASLSGCLCILVAWDESRHELVRALQSLAVPRRVFVLAGKDAPPPADLGPMTGEPENFFALESGRIEESLATQMSGTRAPRERPGVGR